MHWLNKHARLRDQLSPYLDGALSADQRATLDMHFTTCEACRAELDELRSTKAAARELPQVDAPRSFALSPQMLERRSPAAPMPSAPPLALGMRLASAGVAAALAVMVIGDLSGGGGSDSNRQTGDESELSRTMGEFSAMESDQAGGGEVVPAPDTTESSQQFEPQPPAEDAATADRSGTATCAPGAAAAPTAAGAGAGAGGAAGGGAGGAGGPASVPSETPIPQPSASPTPALLAQPETACVEAPVAGAVAPTSAPEPEAAADTSQEGVAASGSAQAEDGGGLSTLRVVELVLGIALIALLAGIALELTVRRRRAA